MTLQVDFYHLTGSPLEEALPLLLGRTLKSGEKALVRCGGAELVYRLDRALWDYDGPYWLPHGSEKDFPEPENAALQPIWITAGAENPALARFLFRVDGAGEEGDQQDFARIFDLFYGADANSVQNARRRWKTFKDRGLARMSYWKQEGRRWVAG